MSTEKQLISKTILITGATSGIGLSVAHAYAKAGADLVILGRDEQKLEALSSLLETTYQISVYPALLDLSLHNPNLYSSLAKSIDENVGHLDGLLHNAGDIGVMSPIEHADFDNWQKIIQVNLTSCFWLTKATLFLLKKAKLSSLLFTAAHFKDTPPAYFSAYGVAKTGLLGLTTMLAQELEHTNIRVNAINPGPTDTKLQQVAFPGGTNSKLFPPDDLMMCYLYMMSDVSHKTHGQYLCAQTWIQEELHLIN